MIEKDIQIYSYRTDIDLRISDGTCIAKGTLSNGTPYRDNAYKPLKPWRQLTLEEKNVIFAKEEDCPDLNSSINIIKVPDFLIQQLNLTKLRRLTNKFNFKFHIEQYKEDIQHSVEILTTFARSYLVQVNDDIEASFAFNTGNLETTTIYLKYNALVGLHIDNFDGLNLENIITAKRRLCINIGKEVRYLLFINLSISRMLKKVKEKKSDLREGYSQWNLYNDFMRLYPNYPVIKIPIRPFEAYIAPAENMIHDGCTEDSFGHDLTIFFRGIFKNKFQKESVLI